MSDEEKFEQETMGVGFVDKPTLMFELETLCNCYQIASQDDKNVVWAALNKYKASLDL